MRVRKYRLRAARYVVPENYREAKVKMCRCSKKRVRRIVTKLRGGTAELEYIDRIMMWFEQRGGTM